MTNQEAYIIIKAFHSRNQMELSFKESKAFGVAAMALGAIDQIRWERDVAIAQLKELGLELGEKVDHVKEAVEKQIAKTPDLEGDGYADGYMVYDTWICPNCEVKYEVDYEEYPYCPECGQKIKHNKDGKS